MEEILWTIPDAKSFQTFLIETFPEMIDDISVESTLKLLQNQKIVSNFLQERTPYRGLLLYHGLGSGKSAASITIAEGYTNRHVVVLLPASLNSNFRAEMSKFKTKNKYTLMHYNSPIAIQSILKELLPRTKYISILHEVKNLNMNDERLKIHKKKIGKEEKIKGKELNHFLDILYTPERNIQNPFSNKTIIIDEVHNLMSMVLGSGTTGIYLYEMMMNATNIRLVCLSGTPAINSIFELAMLFNLLRGYMQVYTFTIESHNKSIAEIKTVLRNYNIINRIYVSEKRIEVTRYPLYFSASVSSNYGEIKKDESHTETDEQFMKTINDLLINNEITVTETKIKNVPLFSDILQDSNDFVHKKRTSDKYTKKVISQFMNTFLNGVKIKNPDLFRKRIIGLVSFYSGVDKSMFPGMIQHDIQKVSMSNFQFKQYSLDRRIERVLEKKSSQTSQLNATIGNTKSTASYFRVLSRQSSLFTFPPINKNGQVLKRPRARDIRAEYLKDKEELDIPIKEINTYVKRELKSRQINLISEVAKWNVIPFDMKFAMLNFSHDNGLDQDTFIEALELITGDLEELKYTDVQNNEYNLQNLNKIINNEQLLSLKTLFTLLQYPLEICSPKYASILRNMNNSPGIIFGYSQFRNLEGIEMYKQTLIHFGYTEFIPTKNEEKENEKVKVGNICRFQLDYSDESKWGTGRVIKYNDGEYTIQDCNTKKQYVTKNAYQAQFSLWTGSESKDKSRLSSVLTVFNSDENKYGQKVFILLATESGAEGISLKNVRQVHVFEPFWNNVRIEQVVGRARRVNSHSALPENQRNVEIFNYVSTFTDDQLSGKWAKDWMQKQFTRTDVRLKNESIDDIRDLDKNMILQRAKKLMYGYSDENKKTDKSKTSDESLMKIAIQKDNVIQQFLTRMKEAAIDCSLNKVANINNDVDVECVKNIIQDGEYTYEPEISSQSEDKFQDVLKVKVKEYHAIIQTSDFKVLIPLNNKTEKLSSIRDQRPIYDYYNFRGMLPVSNQIPYTKHKVGYYNGKTVITDSTHKAKWIILEKILLEQDFVDKLKNNVKKITKIRKMFQTQWSNYQTTLKSASLEDILAMRSKMLQ